MNAFKLIIMKLFFNLFVYGFAILGINRTMAQSDSLFVTTSDGVKLFVKKSGSGEPMLFIHGGPGSNSFYFEKEGGNIFERAATMIYVDQRGCGRSDIPKNGDYSLSRVVKDFDEIRQALGIDKWMVMAHSFGGILATEYAYEYPNTIASMVYLNCTVNILDSGNSVIAKTLEVLPDLSSEEKDYFKDKTIPPIDKFYRAFNLLSKNDKKYILQFEHKENAEMDDKLMGSPFLKWDMAQHVFSYPEYLEDFSPKTSKINIPVLIISGKKDYAIGVDHYKLMKFPQQKVIFIDGAHALYTEHTKELYRRVKPFIRKTEKNWSNKVNT